MLIRFEVANFRSILDPVELSLVAVDRDRAAARRVEHLGHSLLTVAAVYGPNASGKSNLLAALGWLQAAVRDSLRYWEDVIPLEPFAFADGVGRPSEFTVEMTVDGIRFEYVLELNRDRVHYEALFHFPEKKRRRVFSGKIPTWCSSGGSAPWPGPASCSHRERSHCRSPAGSTSRRSRGSPGACSA
ncbi:MAG: ATP/GTP-binding protein [Pseudonocardia sp.]